MAQSRNEMHKVLAAAGQQETAKGAERQRMARYPLVTGLLLVVALTSVGMLTRSSYLSATFVLDDIYYLMEIGLIRIGRSNLGSYLLGLHGGYPHILWKLQFYGQYLMFGDLPVPWRVVIFSIHGVSAACVFALLKKYAASTPAACVGALTWAAIAVGGYDNPFLHIVAGEQVVCIAFVLLSMVCVARCGIRSTVLTAVLMCCFMVATVLTWGVGCAMLPAIVLR